MTEKQLITLERLDEHITFIHEAIKVLQERIKSLENQGIRLERLSDNVNLLNEEDDTLGERISLLEKQERPATLVTEETKDAKTIMADNLKTELEKQLNACKGKIKSLLFRAKFVEKKGLKITGEIHMKNLADNKEKERLGLKLSDIITLNKACISKLTARAVWSEVKGKDLEYRVRVSIAVR